MSGYNANNSRNKEPYFPTMPYLLGKKQQHTGTEKNQGNTVVVVFAVAMKQGVHANKKCQGDHGVFKQAVVNDINAKYRQTGGNQGQNSTMDCTGNRSGNSQGIPVYFNRHAESKYIKMQQSCRKLFY